MILLPTIPSLRLDGSPSSLPYFLKGVSLIKSLHFNPIWEFTREPRLTSWASQKSKEVRILGRWLHVKHQESVPLTLTTSTQVILVWCNYFGAVESIEGLQHPGKTYSKLRLIWGISALSSAEATHPPPSSALWQAVVHMFLEHLAHILQQPGWAIRTPAPKYWGYVFWLITQLLLMKEMQTQQPLLLRLPLLLQAPPLQLKWLQGI